MFSEMDEKKGLVKVYWKDVRNQAAKVEPTFTKIVDELNLNNDFPLYLAYYPYGALKGDIISTFLPKIDGGYYRLTDAGVPKDITKHLGYSKNGAPLALLLDKNLELFIDLKDEVITIPRVLYKPGSFFPFSKILTGKNDRTYAPNGVLTLTSGARSTFMLPNIGCATNHSNLQRDFNIQRPAPKSLYEHWNVFSELINSEVINSDWRSCLMYFSQNWLDHLYADKSWLPLKLYLHEVAWKHYEYQRNDFYYDVAFSVIQKRRNLKPNPYLADTARHLFTIALGAAPGYVPAVNNDSLPVDAIQEIFSGSYGLKKYFPTIMHLAHFNFEQDKHPVYYSLQHPSTHVFSPKSRKISSTLAELRELEHLTKVFAAELAKDNVMCSDTIIGEISRNIKFNYFHNKTDRHRVIQSSVQIPTMDKRFLLKNKKQSKSLFASDAPFVRGCISMQTEK